MKFKNTIILAVLLSIFFTQCTFGQGGLDSVKIIPQFPSFNDKIKAVYYASFSSGGCHLNSYSVNKQGNEILVTLKYQVGYAAAQCKSIDTLSIGYFYIGNYTLITNVINSEELIYDSDTTSFKVGVVQTQETKQGNSFNLYPNPTNEYVNVAFLDEPYNLVIYDILGREMERIDKNEIINNNLKINISNYPKGMYLFVFEQSDKKVLKKLIKN